MISRVECQTCPNPRLLLRVKQHCAESVTTSVSPITMPKYHHNIDSIGIELKIQRSVRRTDHYQFCNENYNRHRLY